MPVIVNRPVYRQPWLWGVILALVALLTIVFMIAATTPQGSENTTVVSPAPGTVTTPAPIATAPQPTVVEKPVPVPVPVPGKTQVVEKPVPVPGPTKTKVIEKPVPVPATPESTPNPSVSSPESAPEQTYRDTGLPRQVRFEDRNWKATGILMGPESDQHLVPADDVTIDGRTVYHKESSSPPYDRIYVKTEGRDNQFVVYEPAQ
jgi:outer membrane biosynthesis protein TonB